MCPNHTKIHILILTHIPFILMRRLRLKEVRLIASDNIRQGRGKMQTPSAGHCLENPQECWPWSEWPRWILSFFPAPQLLQEVFSVNHIHLHLHRSLLSCANHSVWHCSELGFLINVFPTNHEWWIIHHLGGSQITSLGWLWFLHSYFSLFSSLSTLRPSQGLEFLHTGWKVNSIHSEEKARPF